VIVAGSSGFLGSWLVPDLQSRGHAVTRLLRPDSAEIPGIPGVPWDPARGELDPSVLDGADAVVNLAGANIAAGRWTARRKRLLESSRLASTRTLVRALERCTHPPRVLINASATGVYGDRGEEELTEASPPGTGFLASLARRWEAEAAAAERAGARVALLRFGMIVGRGGALARMLPAFRLGLGGPVGGGRQFWPWVGMEDAVGAVRLALEDDGLAGPVNVVDPQPVRCRDFVHALGAVLRRPAVLTLPAPAARLLLGGMAAALLLASQKVLPARLAEARYPFRAPDLATAIRHALD